MFSVISLVAAFGLLATGISLLQAAETNGVESQVFGASAEPVVGRYSSGPRVSIPENKEQGLLFHGEKAGDYLDLTLPGLLPGRYQLHISYLAHQKRGSYQVSFGKVDGNELQVVAAKLDQRGDAFQEAQIGIVSIDRMGNHKLRFELTSMPSGTGKLSLATISLIPAPQREYHAPSGIKATQIAGAFCELQWQGDDRGEVLIAHRGGKSKEWQVVGFVPAGHSRFTAVGLCDDSDYSFRLCRYGADGRSAWSAELAVHTSPADHSMQGHHISKSVKKGRIGGGSMVKRKDGSLLLYAHYQEKLADQGRFEIHALDSQDSGETWSERRVILSDESSTYMMPALLRLDDGSLLFSYTQRDLKLTWGKRFACRSTDDGKTWSQPVVFCDEPFTWQSMRFSVPTGPHDRLIQTSSGRVIFPIHFPHFEGPKKHHPKFIVTRVVYSDDRGATWQMAERIFAMRGIIPAASKRRDLTGFWEPSIVETAAGELLMYLRSNTGWYYESRSHDDGTNWSTPQQSSIRAPLCPAKLIRLGDGRIAAIFNGIIDLTHQNLSARWDLGTMVSSDAGKTWHDYRNLEFADPQKQRYHLYYCYPTALFDGTYWHFSYYKNFHLVYQRQNADWFDADRKR